MLGFYYLQAIIINISRIKGLTYFDLFALNLYNIWVSISEMSDKNIDLFHNIQFFLDVPVYAVVLVLVLKWLVWRY